MDWDDMGSDTPEWVTVLGAILVLAFVVLGAVMVGLWLGAVQ